MLRNLFKNKWFISGSSFLIFFMALCYFWYQHEIKSFQQQLPIIDAALLQASDRTNISNQTMEHKGVKQLETFESAKNKSESVRDKSVPADKTTEITDNFKNNIDLTTNGLTSPFGFGPYPEVPADFPYQEKLWDNATPEHELLVRVRVKLWKQGTQTKGAMFDINNGLIYPSIPGVIYVKWRHIEEGDPDLVGRRYAGRVTGDRNTGEMWQSLYLTDRMFERTDVFQDTTTSGIKVYEYPDGGIDPYKFLELPR